MKAYQASTISDVIHIAKMSNERSLPTSTLQEQEKKSSSERECKPLERKVSSLAQLITILDQDTVISGAKMLFLVFRQQSATLQALVQVEPELVSKKMVKFAEGITSESIVLVEGIIQKPIELIKGCTVQDAEVKISKVREFSFEALTLR